MKSPWILLKIIGKAALHASGVGGIWSIVLEDLPELAQVAWEEWHRTRNADQRREDLEAQAALVGDISVDVEPIVAEIAADQPEWKQRELAAYLSQIPNAIRRSLRRPADPTGRTVSPALAPKSAQDFIPFLDASQPKLNAGYHLPGTDWILRDLLGVGGYGEVWLAHHAFGTFKPVAIKFGEELKREAAVCARVMEEGQHHGVARLRNTYLSANPPCVEYEYVPGGNLVGLIKEWHERKPRVSAEQITRHLLDIADTVAFMHRLDPPIVHRDLKPANILVVGTNGDTKFKITDFGISGIATIAVVRGARQPTNPKLMFSKSVSGSHTALYASPEQALGGKADPRDDVHALGVIWFQMLTGDLTEGRQSGDRWKQELIDLGLTKGLTEVMASCFEKAKYRPENAGVLVGQIREALGQKKAVVETVIVTPEPPKKVPPQAPPTQFTNSLGMTMVRIEPGEFQMGISPAQLDKLLKLCPGTQKGWYESSQPQHPVKVTRPFYFAAHQITVGQFRRFVDTKRFKTDAETNGEGSRGWIKGAWKQDKALNWRNPGFAQTDDHPVVCVSHNDAVAFLTWLNDQEKSQKRTYRLPTEAEWEYAARAGTGGLWGAIDDPEGLVHIANVADESLRKAVKGVTGGIKGNDGFAYTSPVGSFEPNGWKLYDMIGNVWEWCDDWFDAEYYTKSPRENTHNTAAGASRVYRGGSWYDTAVLCAAGYRDSLSPGCSNYSMGFRILAVPF